jgi:phosphoribosylglycinamide formyltransferase-1
MALSPVNLAVLVSGGGTTLQNLIDETAAGRLDAKIKLVVGSRAGLMGVERAKMAGIPSVVIDRKSAEDLDSFARQVWAAIDQANVDLVVMAGWLCLLPIPTNYLGRVINIHPSLLPDFGGKGMYGKRVHQAVIDQRATVSGCTVHFVDDQFDNGPIILQRSCEVHPDDTAETLAARVFEEEKVAYPQAIRLFAEGKLAEIAGKMGEKGE